MGLDGELSAHDPQEMSSSWVDSGSPSSPEGQPGHLPPAPRPQLLCTCVSSLSHQSATQSFSGWPPAQGDTVPGPAWWLWKW